MLYNPSRKHLVSKKKGNQMTQVSALLKATHKDPSVVYNVGPNTSIVKASTLMEEKNIGALLVMEGEILLGIVPERDITRKVARYPSVNSDVTRVSQIMTPNPETVSLGTELTDCMALMEQKGFRHVPVVDKGKVVGVVSMRDILVALVRHQELVAQNLFAYITGSPYRG